MLCYCSICYSGRGGREKDAHKTASLFSSSLTIAGIQSQAIERAGKSYKDPFLEHSVALIYDPFTLKNCYAHSCLVAYEGIMVCSCFWVNGGERI